MIEKVLKAVGVSSGLFLIGSSNYVFNMIIMGDAPDIASGIVLYIGSGVTYLFGLALLGIAYLFSAGRRDIPLGISLIIAGVIHYYPIVNALLTDPDLIFLWALQFALSIIVSSLLFYLGVRKLRRRLVEIPVYTRVEY